MRASRRQSFAVAVCALLAAACSGDSSPEPDAADSAIVVVDDGRRTVRLDAPARRVVSLLPSATDMLLALDAGELIVGRTRYDSRPEVAAVPSMGGGLDPSIEAILALQPDLVISGETDPSSRTRVALAAAGVPTVGLWARDTTDVYAAVERLGRLVGRGAAADSLAARMRAEVAAVAASVRGRPRPTVLYLVATSPPMAAGPGLFVGQLVEVAGGQLVVEEAGALSPTLSLEEIVRRDPDVLVLPVGESDVRTVEGLRALAGWRELRAVREGRVVTIPADLANRPGPEMGLVARLLADGIHGSATAVP